MKPLIALLFTILLASWVNENQDDHSISVAALYQFVRMGKKVDTTLKTKDYSVYYCKIGNFLIPAEKTALLICNNAAELYVYKNGKPVKECRIAVPNLDSRSEFQVTYDDYNFDGQKDIYIQRTLSNGWPMSLGCLITVNKSANRLERHDECDNLANMQPDPKRKVVVTDSIPDCCAAGRKQQLCKVLNKWQRNKLMPLAKGCRCK